jgi:CheY-like chemotaxis protein
LLTTAVSPGRDRAYGSAAGLLLVDDQPDLLAPLLTHAGYTVHVARSGNEALSRPWSFPAPSLILLGLPLADMTGREFRSRQRLTPALAAVPVVLLSADAREAGELGVVAHLSKPVENDSLLAVVGHWASAP